MKVPCVLARVDCEHDTKQSAYFSSLIDVESWYATCDEPASIGLAITQHSWGTILAGKDNAQALARLEGEIPHLRRFARYLARDVSLADDLVQECLTRAVANIDSWQSGTNLRAWLFVILRNAFLNERRKKKHDTVPLADDGHPALTVTGGQESGMALKEVNDALLKLSHDHREIIMLIGVEGMSYEEVSAILDVPLGTVRSRLARARQALRGKIEDGKGKGDKRSKENTRD